MRSWVLTHFRRFLAAFFDEELLLKHGDSAEGSKTLLRKRWAQVRKQDHPPVGKMKAVDVYKYMYFVADKLDFDWSTVLTPSNPGTA
eukprot:COSAG01_NODE_4915_length_4629_cov_17.202649_4_plen_87_part_00